MTGVYRIAGHDIGIDSNFPDIHSYCEAYRSEGTPEITVSVPIEELEAAWQSAEWQILHGELPQREHSMAYLELIRTYKRIAERMPEWDVFMMHGSTIAVDGEGYLFTASSGTGKSTHARLWREMLGERAVMVNDDKPLIHVDADGGTTVYGTPWNGKHRLGNNIAVPLKAICVLERDTTNHIERVTKESSYAMLLQQTYRPANPVALGATLKLLDRMNVAYYRLGCNMEPEAARVSYEGMKG